LVYIFVLVDRNGILINVLYNMLIWYCH